MMSRKKYRQEEEKKKSTQWPPFSTYPSISLFVRFPQRPGPARCCALYALS